MRLLSILENQEYLEKASSERRGLSGATGTRIMLHWDLGLKFDGFCHGHRHQGATIGTTRPHRHPSTTRGLGLLTSEAVAAVLYPRSGARDTKLAGRYSMSMGPWIAGPGQGDVPCPMVIYRSGRLVDECRGRLRTSRAFYHSRIYDTG